MTKSLFLFPNAEITLEWILLGISGVGLALFYRCRKFAYLRALAFSKCIKK